MHETFSIQRYPLNYRSNIKVYQDVLDVKYSVLLPPVALNDAQLLPLNEGIHFSFTFLVLMLFHLLRRRG